MVKAISSWGCKFSLHMSASLSLGKQECAWMGGWVDPDIDIFSSGANDDERG